MDHLYHTLDFTYKLYGIAFPFLTSLSVIVSSPILLAAVGIIAFSLRLSSFPLLYV